MATRNPDLSKGSPRLSSVDYRDLLRGEITLVGKQDPANRRDSAQERSLAPIHSPLAKNRNVNTIGSAAYKQDSCT